MKQVFSKPLLHIVPLSEGIDAASLAELPVEELLRVYLESREAEADVVLRSHPDIIVRKIGDEWILVPTGDLAQHFNGMVSLNEFGYFIWQQFQQPRAIGEVLQVAKDTYGDSRGIQDLEIRSFIREYALMGLFQEVNNNN
ncbi:MAG: PqqD family protein [Bacteroidaceae bacterium]|nr:PqqD family protein [Bacteroidaceae bacterium]